MNRYPKISIVTITYGHEKYITDTLDSIFMQDYPGEIEVIISNDHSPDNTDEIIHDYLSNKNIPNNFNIQYTKHEINKGVGPNFSWTLQEATGKYIALCEGDDYWTDPLKLQKQVDFLEENSNYVACGCYTDLERFGKMEVKELPFLERSYTQEDLVIKHPFSTLTFFFRNVDLTAFSSYKDIVGDIELKMYLSRFGDFKKLPFNGGVYRYHGEGANSGESHYTNRKKNLLAVLKFNETYKIYSNKVYKTTIKNFIINELKRIFKNIVLGRKGFMESIDYIKFCVKQYKTL